MSASPTTRDLLVQTGRVMLAETGLEALGLRAITRRAGVSHGAPRRHFPTHNSLLAAIAQTGIDELSALQVPLLTSRQLSTRLRLIEAGRVYVRYAIDNRAMFELMFRHDLLEGAGANLRNSTLPLLDLFLEAVGNSDSAANRTHAVSLWVGLHGLAVLAANRVVEMAVPDFTPDVLDAMICATVDRHLPPASVRTSNTD